jgi:hypothetical protein
MRKKENKTLLPQAGGLVQSVGLDEVSAWVGSIKLAGCIVYLGCTQVHNIYTVYMCVYIYMLIGKFCSCRITKNRCNVEKEHKARHIILL